MSQIYTSRQIRRRAREIAARFRQRYVYDSTYAALAELRNCEFWTADEEFYRRVQSELRFVKYLAEYPILSAQNE